MEPRTGQLLFLLGVELTEGRDWQGDGMERESVWSKHVQTLTYVLTFYTKTFVQDSEDSSIFLIQPGYGDSNKIAF